MASLLVAPLSITFLNEEAAPALPPASLAAYYKFDEGGGSSITDASGNGNAGALLPGASFTPSGRMGGALSLIGDSGAQAPGGP